MNVSASINTDYLFVPHTEEFRPFHRVFNGIVNRTREGFTLAKYDAVPDFVVAGNTYFSSLFGFIGGATADETRSFDTKQACLHYLKHTINLGDREIIDASRGIRLPPGNTINPNQLQMVINHIPQLYELYENDKVLIGFNGVYNFKSKLFKGQCEFAEWAELWND